MLEVRSTGQCHRMTWKGRTKRVLFSREGLRPMMSREPCKDPEEGCSQHRICKVCRGGNQLKAFHGLAGSPRGWDRAQGGGVLECRAWRLRSRQA